MNKTKFNWISDGWIRVKNHCRTTVRKEFTDKEPSDTFKKKLLIAEHSPIRLLEFDWTWKEIPYYVAMEWARHKFEKFISSQRNDRQNEYNRNAARQDTPVIFDGYANMQNLIDAWRKRLCYQATTEARGFAEDFKIELRKTHPFESDVLVPNCIYRAGCPEMHSCGMWDRFTEWVMYESEYELSELDEIDKRYELYNEWFYEERQGE